MAEQEQDKQQKLLQELALMVDEWATLETGLWSPSAWIVRCWHKPGER